MLSPQSIIALLSHLGYRLHNGSQKSFHYFCHKYLVSLCTKKGHLARGVEWQMAKVDDDDDDKIKCGLWLCTLLVMILNFLVLNCALLVFWHFTKQTTQGHLFRWWERIWYSATQHNFYFVNLINVLQAKSSYSW